MNSVLEQAKNTLLTKDPRYFEDDVFTLFPKLVEELEIALDRIDALEDNYGTDEY